MWKGEQQHSCTGNSGKGALGIQMSAGCALGSAAWLSRDVGAFTGPSAAALGEVGLKEPHRLLLVRHLTSILVLGQAFCAGLDISHCVKLPDSGCLCRPNVPGFSLSKTNVMLFLL